MNSESCACVAPAENPLGSKLQDIGQRLYQTLDLSQNIEDKLFGCSSVSDKNVKQSECVNDYVDGISDLVDKLIKTLGTVNEKL